MGRYARARHERDMAIGDFVSERTQNIIKQFMFDCACVALHREFGFGPARLQRFYKAQAEVANQFGNRLFRLGKIRQANGDKLDSDYELARHQLDELLLEAFGEEVFEDFGKRYGDYIK